MFDWTQIILGLLTLAGTGAVGLITVKATRRSSKEVNEITGFGTLLTQYDNLAANYQADRTADRAAIAELKSQLGEQKAELNRLSRMFAGYRAYIRTLRGQIFDLGGKPADWPPDLDQ